MSDGIKIQVGSAHIEIDGETAGEVLFVIFALGVAAAVAAIWIFA